MWIDLLWISAGIFLMVGGAESLVRGASGLALKLGIAPLVVGLTVVALGTSAPELVVGITSALEGKGQLAVGTVVGSNIFNLLLILGMAGLFAPVAISREAFRFDITAMVLATLAVALMAVPGLFFAEPLIDWRMGLVLVFGLIVFIGLALLRAFRSDGEGVVDDVPEAPQNLVLLIILILLGLVMLKFGGDFLVTGAVSAAQRMGVSEAIIGLTIVAIGSSLPELATAVVASLKGQGDLVVGNVIGSNIFNVFCILGVSSLFGNLPYGDVDWVTIAFLIGSVVLTIPFLWTKMRLDRWEAGIMLSAAVGYVLVVVLTAT